jgi:hypothetical protein
MGLFGNRKAAFAVAPEIKGAASGATQTAINQVYTYMTATAELRALQIPTISRARDLIASMVGCLDLRKYSLAWNPDELDYDKIYAPGESWFTRPDPGVTRNLIMSQTFSDLFFFGRSFWYVTARYSTGYPSAFRYLPIANIETPGQIGPQFFQPSEVIEFNGIELDPANVVQFISPIMGLIYQGSRAIDIATRLDDSARRFAMNEISAGYLQQRGGEPMSADELSELAAAWSAARQRNAIGALNEFVEWHEFSSDPSKLQLVESRQFASLELARVANIPPYLLGIGVPGYTYQNAQQARQDLYLFGAKPYLDCIQETLSMDNVLPRGSHVEFDLDDYLGDNNLINTPLVEPAVPSAENGMT